VLDVGCGEGTFLRLARSRGWQVAGTELSAFASQASPDLTIHHGEIWEAGLRSGSFDVVTCWHVLEHVSDPLRLLSEVFRLLRPGGLLFLTTPNSRDYLFRLAYLIARGHWPPLYEPAERELHLYYFNAPTLRALAEKAGFRNVTIGYDEGAAVTPAKRLVNRLGFWWYRATSLHWGMGLQLVARKAEGS
jgi:SAM-dependent methyltransferase